MQFQFCRSKDSSEASPCCIRTGSCHGTINWLSDKSLRETHPVPGVVRQKGLIWNGAEIEESMNHSNGNLQANLEAVGNFYSNDGVLIHKGKTCAYGRDRKFPFIPKLLEFLNQWYLSYSNQLQRSEKRSNPSAYLAIPPFVFLLKLWSLHLSLAKISVCRSLTKCTRPHPITLSTRQHSSPLSSRMERKSEVSWRLWIPKIVAISGKFEQIFRKEGDQWLIIYDEFEA